MCELPEIDNNLREEALLIIGDLTSSSTPYPIEIQEELTFDREATARFLEERM